MLLTRFGLTCVKGTTLEDTFRQNIACTPLWSAIPIEENAELIVDAHLAFLRAGAEIILTSTYVYKNRHTPDEKIVSQKFGMYRYQCSRETFEQAGYAPEEGIQIMRKAVRLADDARKAYIAEGGGVPTKEVSVALSLGPFGSAVKPPQDFDGFYPPPFGPKGPSDELGSGGSNTRLFSSSGDPGVVVEEEEKRAIEALAGFHLWRLRAVASDAETWNSVDYVAFETVPHLRELRAIKVAMARFDAENTRRGGGLKGWWISLVFPDGEGSVQWGPGEREHQTRDLADRGQSEILNVVLDGRIGAVPTGLGINCTRVDQYPSILSSITSRFHRGSPSEEEEGKGPVPLTLVIYPNGGRFGDTFDHLTYRWTNDGGPRPDSRNITWEEEVVEVVQKCRDEWKDVIVGGCCRVYPPQIKRLREKVNEAL